MSRITVDRNKGKKENERALRLDVLGKGRAISPPASPNTAKTQKIPHFGHNSVTIFKKPNKMPLLLVTILSQSAPKSALTSPPDPLYSAP